MARQHEKHDFVRGDTWKIYGTIRDDRGALLDVTSLISGSKIKWVLGTANNTRIIDVGVAVVTAVDADQGDILITVNEDDTDIPAGRYTDYCWIDMPDGRCTKWFGEIWVQAGPPPAP